MILNESPEKLQKELYKRTMLVALIPLLSSLIMGELSGFLGLIIGLAVSFLLFRLKVINLNRALDMKAGKAQSFIRNRYFLNYLIYFVILLTAKRNPNFDFLGTAVGMLLMKFTIFGTAVIELLKDKWKNKIKQYEKGGLIDESRS
ncbi:MAG: ATP synthase subunit I [Halothermotrichaceae bacterium]